MEARTDYLSLDYDDLIPQTGKLQITKFLAGARMQQGDKFNLRAFHDFLWKNGNVPIALQSGKILVEDKAASLTRPTCGLHVE